MEAVYYMFIFFLRAIQDMYYEARLMEPTPQRFVHMVLSALNNWLDCSLIRYIERSGYLDNVNMRFLKCLCSLRSLLHL